jgi:hypothetical protein
MTVADAAARLLISKEAVRKRITRGTLRSDKDPDGTVYVYVPSSGTPSATPSGTDRDELVVELRDRVRSLERRLDEEGESRRRADTIIVQLTQANAALTERMRELEPPAEERHLVERRPEVPKEEPADDTPPRPWWQETLKTALPTVAPLITAAVSGFGSIFAAAEGAIALAVGSFAIAVTAAVIGGSFGIKLLIEHRERRMQQLMEEKEAQMRHEQIMLAQADLQELERLKLRERSKFERENPP